MDAASRSGGVRCEKPAGGAMVVPGGARLRDGLSHGVGIAIGRDAQNRCVVTRVLPGGAAAFSGQVAGQP